MTPAGEPNAENPHVRFEVSGRIDKCELAALAFFCAIEKHVGLEEAYRIFSKFGTPPSDRKRALIKNLALLDLYDTMDKPNVQRLAWQLAAENKTLPPEERWGPRGTTSPVTLDKHIRRLLEERNRGPKR
jgi:hypothetical protein